MKITIESTHSPIEYSTKSTVEMPRDDLTVDELVQMFSSCAVGFGFSQENLNERLGEG